MVRLFIIILSILIAWFLLRRFLKAPSEYSKKILLWGLFAVLILLLLSGKLNAIFAIVGIFLAAIIKLLPIVLQFFPQLRRLWFFLKRESPVNDPSSSQKKSFVPTDHKMTVKEAYDVLGLQADASREAILLAHRRLMQKVHPDRGGSNYLATEINRAKDILINAKN